MGQSVNERPLAADAVDEIASGFAEVAAGIGEEVSGRPTLAEFLEVLGWAIPANSDVLDGVVLRPLQITATLRDGKRYTSEGPSRIPELNDHVFVDATDTCAVMVERIHSTSGAPVTPQQLASAILQVLRTGKISLADVGAEEVRRLLLRTSGKGRIRVVPGDVLAIPVSPDGYRLAVVIARNRFGTALGVFDGVSAQGRPSGQILRAPWKQPVYTEESLIGNGTWKIVGHDDSLLELFPADPEIYHRPDAWPGIADTGEFGAAETADGALRMLDEHEARKVGLHDGTYRQTHLAEHLPAFLRDAPAVDGRNIRT